MGGDGLSHQLEDCTLIADVRLQGKLLADLLAILHWSFVQGREHEGNGDFVVRQIRTGLGRRGGHGKRALNRSSTATGSFKAG